MALDGLRAYMQLANGLTEVTRSRAMAAARALLDQSGGSVPGQVRQQVSTIAEELISTSRANRELIVTLVDGEVERVAARLGLVAQEQLERMTERAERLERRVRELELSLADQTPARSRRMTGDAEGTAERAAAKKVAAVKAVTGRPAGAKPAKTTGRTTGAATKRAAARESAQLSAGTTPEGTDAAVAKKVAATKAAVAKQTPGKAAAAKAGPAKAGPAKAAPAKKATATSGVTTPGTTATKDPATPAGPSEQAADATSAGAGPTTSPAARVVKGRSEGAESAPAKPPAPAASRPQGDALLDGTPELRP
jgi:polyhydroxyalkanoate synthesis regulator phasin